MHSVKVKVSVEPENRIDFQLEKEIRFVDFEDFDFQFKEKLKPLIERITTIVKDFTK